MVQLIVRNLEEKVARKLREKAAKDGVSMEEEHRRILKAALFPPRRRKDNLTQFLLEIPPQSDAEPDDLFKRDRRPSRKVRL